MIGYFFFLFSSYASVPEEYLALKTRIGFSAEVNASHSFSDKTSDNEYNMKVLYWLCRDVPGQLNVLIIFGMLCISITYIFSSLTPCMQLFSMSTNSDIIFFRDAGVLLL